MSTLHHQPSPYLPLRGNVAEIAGRLDHTNLRPTSGKRDIEQLCKEAAKYAFGAVCVAPRWVKTAVDFLSAQGADSVNICTVIGFPHGNTTTEGKAFEATKALEIGASEIDMVLSIGDLIAGNRSYVEDDIATVAEVVHSRESILKVILETAYLSKDEIVLGCELAVRSGANFVKSSTGFGPGGADLEVISLMRETVGDKVGVKAAGGIKTLANARAMLDAGASRLGCSSSVEIMKELMGTT